MTFSVRQTMADANLEPFDFEGSDGEMYELPNLKALAAGLVELLDSDDTLGALCAIAPHAADEFRRMPILALGKLTEAWQSHAEDKPGESAASSPSSASTARPSKQTSRATTTSRTRKR